MGIAPVTDYPSLVAAIGAWTHRSDLTAGSPPFADTLIQAAQAQFGKDVLDLNFGNGIRFQEATYAPSLITGGALPVPSDWQNPKLLTVACNGTVQPLIFKAAAWLYDIYPVSLNAGIPAYIARDVMASATFTASLASTGVLTVTAVASGLLQGGMILSDGGVNLPPNTPGNALVISGQITTTAANGVMGNVGTYQVVSISPLQPTYDIASQTMTGGGNFFTFGPSPDSNYQVEGTYYQTAPLLSADGAQTNWMVEYAPMTLLAYCMVAAAQFLENPQMLQTWSPIAQAGCKGLVDKDKAERWGNSTLAVNVG